MYVFNNIELTEETVQQTRKYFRDVCIACIEEVKSGKCKVNDPKRYFLQKNREANDYIEGKNDHVFNFLQRAYYYQTGKSIALLP
ncbi:hypothetical protein [Enterococcus mundtii]|uniref:hypothetical protein n=1 Tax=Enterococcus mundtii TaxID=53346 RepID=UPI001A95F128|nr:hypothetical protein [Enterococcus mundtii]MBO1087142.1 hypothetical protein [Enterococcus mundtii]